MDRRQSVLGCELQGPADLSLVESLIRLQLVARRLGVRLEVWASEELVELLVLTGLDLVLKPGRQPEPREEDRGVKEVVEVDEPPV